MSRDFRDEAEVSRRSSVIQSGDTSVAFAALQGGDSVQLSVLPWVRCWASTIGALM